MGRFGLDRQPSSIIHRRLHGERPSLSTACHITIADTPHDQHEGI